MKTHQMGDVGTQRKERLACMEGASQGMRSAWIRESAWIVCLDRGS